MNVEHIIMVIKLDIVINNIMAKVVYFGKHISDKIRDANRVFSEILISPFIKTYNAIYRNAFTVTNVYGHVILDKSINYGKQ